MKMRVLRWRGCGAAVLALATCLAAAPARADGANVAGYGALSCAQAVAALDNVAERHGIVQWTLGFMSGANAAQMIHAGTFRDLTNLNAELVAGSLRAACAETPGAPLVTAAEKLFSSRLVRTAPKQR
ncbi:hypothetical protein BHAOGJBA_4736 [Methylobacterium hispanicum]|uniref:HdeA/HdeB family protein n=1 Tax=Methylobacterium hispanicum TaxID=270350 RepID=A0AAV4ZTI7_9HYPH|nr:hypothetical protein BHAOGJBA_4736 [Methylobacterium hispanicum]